MPDDQCHIPSRNTNTPYCKTKNNTQTNFGQQRSPPSRHSKSALSPNNATPIVARAIQVMKIRKSHPATWADISRNIYNSSSSRSSQGAIEELFYVVGVILFSSANVRCGRQPQEMADTLAGPATLALLLFASALQHRRNEWGFNTWPFEISWTVNWSTLLIVRRPNSKLMLFEILLHTIIDGIALTFFQTKVVVLQDNTRNASIRGAADLTGRGRRRNYL